MTKTHLISRAAAVLLAGAALVVAAPTGAPGAPAAAQAVVGNCTPGADWGTVRTDFANQVVALVNQHRASRGLTQLSVTAAPTASAVWKARHMAKYLYMTHNDPAPPIARTTAQRMEACGVTGGWGENIAYGYQTPQSVMQAWLNSSGHRWNIENASYRSIGVGAVVASTGQVYWAQAFSTQTGSAPPPPPPPPAPACSNGTDDDGDGKVDYPADPGCTSSSDTDEYNAPPPPPPSTPACSNGKDDDGDGKVDYPADPGCTSSSDTDEYNAPPPPPPSTPACSNGKDDDFDGKVDYPADPGCTSPADTNEFNFTIGV
jgi:uncharacterized protein YkwD